MRFNIYVKQYNINSDYKTQLPRWDTYKQPYDSIDIRATERVNFGVLNYNLTAVLQGFPEQSIISTTQKRTEDVPDHFLHIVPTGEDAFVPDTKQEKQLRIVVF